MADITFTLKDLLDDHIKELAAGNPLSKVAYDGFVTTFGAALKEKIRIPVPDLPRAAEEARKAVAEALSPIDPAKALSPIDPAKALRDIASAVSEAEKAFNGQNLAVLNGRVNVQLVVNVGGAAGAQANFDLTIGPSPQG